MTDKCVALSTCASIEEAQRIAQHLIAERVAACVNILPGATSVYRWKGVVETTSEVLLIIKTSRGVVPRLEEELRAAHSYEVPELVVLPILAGSASYLSWLAAELNG